MYQILFPIITGVFLALTFLGPYYNPLLTGMLMFGFETVNLLLLIACAVYTAQKSYSLIALYGICVLPVLISMTLGDVLGSVLHPILVRDFAYMVNVLFLCVYLLSLVLVLVSRRKKLTTIPELPNSILDDECLLRSSDGTDFLPSTHESSSTNLAFEPLTKTLANQTSPKDREEELTAHSASEECFRERGLSPREIEVAVLLIKDHSVAATARKLFISENTTRGHTKSIYKKLDIHSRQDMIDLQEG